MEGSLWRKWLNARCLQYAGIGFRQSRFVSWCLYSAQYFLVFLNLNFHIIKWNKRVAPTKHTKNNCLQNEKCSQITYCSVWHVEIPLWMLFLTSLSILIIWNHQTRGKKMISPLDRTTIRFKVKDLIQSDRTNKWLSLAFTNICCYSTTF